MDVTSLYRFLTQRDGETGRRGDGETRRQGDGETGRRGDVIVQVLDTEVEEHVLAVEPQQRDEEPERRQRQIGLLDVKPAEQDLDSVGLSRGGQVARIVEHDVDKRGGQVIEIGVPDPGDRELEVGGGGQGLGRRLEPGGATGV